MKKLFLLLVVVGMIFTACTPGSGFYEENNGNPTEQPNDDGNNTEQPGGGQGKEPVFITDNEGNIVIEAKGGTVEITVSTNLEYSVEIPEEAQSWLSIADTRTIRMEKLTFTVAENEEKTERSAIIKLVGNDNAELQSISFVQKGASAEQPGDNGGDDTPTHKNPIDDLTCAPNEILYTTKYGLVIELGNTQGFGGNLVYNTYENGVGRLTFGNDVTAIPENAFKDCNSMEYIKMPDGVKSFGSNAFCGCTSLTSVKIGNSVTSIGSSAFRDCTSLTSVTIPDSVTSIGKGAFSNCTGEIIINSKIVETDYTTSTYPYNSSDGWLNGSEFTKLTLGDNITKIGDYTFYKCSSLTTVTIPDSVTSIGDFAFLDCSSLTSVYCKPTTPPMGGSDMFSYYSSGYYSPLDCKIYVPHTSVSAYKSVKYWNYYAALIVSYDFEKGDVVMSRPANNEIWYTSTDGVVIEPYATYDFGANIVSNTCENYKGVIIFDAPITSIGDYAFYKCSSLTSVIIPDSVTSIGEIAFGGCSSLTSVTIPDSVTSIGEGAFASCSSLTSVTIPDSVTSIGERAFSGCSSLTSVKIGNSVTSIGNEAFCGCSSLTAFYGKSASADNRCLIIDGVLNSFAPAGLTEYTIPDSVTSIGNYAFEDCTSLTSITIPDSVTSIGKNAFWECSSLTSVTIGNGVTSIGDAAFASCYSLRSVNIPDSVTSIGNSAFSVCSSLAIITIPDSVTSIGDSAFHTCRSLRSATIGSSVTSIGSEAFYDCSRLTSVTIPDSVTSIGDSAFQICARLRSVYCKPTTPPTAIADSWGHWDTFYGNASGRKIYVPTASVDAYKSASYWSDYASDIEGYDF